MAAILPADYAVVGSNTYTSANVVGGTFNVTRENTVVDVTLASGRMLRVMQAYKYSGTIEVYGDEVGNLEVTAPTLGATVTVKDGGAGGTNVCTGTATWTAEYSKASETTTINFAMDPTVA